jgi:hypothetical protein
MHVRRIRFRTGLKVPANGLYRVRHKEHALPMEVTLLKDEHFPCCSRCDKPVHFELALGISDETLIPLQFRVVLHQLPVIEEETEEKASAASNSKAG